MKFLSLFVCSVFICLIVAEDDPQVCIQSGCVKGTTFKGNIKEFDGFLGIPYAKPPINELRLKDPIKFGKWDGVYNATTEKMYCMQKNYLLPNPEVSGVEDCLYLYVYRPKNVIKKKRKELPVIIYIHGGAMFAGYAGPSVTGADYFMDTEDVIFVTINYRLGPLGFLSTGDSNMAGNFGLKDQAMAIKWVKDNIKAFGGNASNIALMGQSAGAWSAQLHMMSSWSRNLFSKVIMLSGNANAPYAYVIQDPLKQARDFAKAMDIENYEKLDSKSLAKFLRASNPKSLIDACDSFKFFSVDPMTISRPVVEDCSTNNGFLCEDPVDSWKNGNFAKVPILTGFMEQDGAIRAINIIENKTQLSEINKRFDELLIKLMEVENPSAEINAKNLKAITERYFNGISEVSETSGSSGNSSFYNLIKMYTERAFIAPLYNTLQQIDQLENKISAYVYKFSFKGPLSYSVFFTGKPHNYGPVHCDELIYLLKSPLLFPQDFDKNSVEAAFRAKFVKFFTSFVINGEPSKINGKEIKKCEDISIKPSTHKCKYIEFGENLTFNFDGEIDGSIADFWNEIDNTMVKKKMVSPTVEVSQILKKNPPQQNFESGL